MNFNKFYANDSMGGSGNSKFSIDDELVPAAISNMRETVDAFNNRISDFNFSDGWSSENAETVKSKIEEIHQSIDSIKQSITTLNTNVSAFVSNVKSADFVNINSGN